MSIRFGAGNNNILVDVPGETYLGEGGNDVYIIDPAVVQAGSQINISDNLGTNTVRLVGGLTITGSQFTASALLLTLSNGTKVFVDGASTFGYQVGGTTTGVGATNNTFTQLAATLGATIPGTGGNVTIGTATAPTVSFDSTSVSLVEGNVGTSNAVFTVKLSAAQATAVNVNYATANGSATTADPDYTATSGVLTFAPGELTKTISVPVIGDTKFETNETFTLTLSGVSGGTGVTLGAASVATGTIINDDVNQVPTISSLAGPAGTPVPAQTTQITPAGWFGDFTVTDPDTTLLTTTVTATNGLVRLTDAGGLLSYQNGYVQNTNATIIGAQGSAANLSSILDTIQYTPNGVAGSTDQVTVTINDGTTTVSKVVDVAVGGTFTLTAAANNLTGTAAGDLFLGTGDTSVGGKDTVAGGLGTDTIRYTGLTTDGGALLAAASSITSVEIVDLRTLANAATYGFKLDAGLVGGLQSIQFTPAAEPVAANLDDLAVTNLGDSQVVFVNSSTNTLDLKNANAVATAGTQVVNVTLTGGVTIGTDLIIGNAETINLVSNGDNGASGGNTVTKLSDTNGTGIASDLVNISGSRDLTIAGMTASKVGTFNAQTFTGKLVLDASGNVVATAILGGTGNDSLLGGAGADIINGGAGNDTITSAAGTAQLIGGAGADKLTGAAGADKFTYTTLSDSTAVTPSTTLDTITDFTSATDFIVVSVVPTSTSASSGINLTAATVATTAGSLSAAIAGAVVSGTGAFDQAGDIIDLTLTGPAGIAGHYLVINDSNAGYQAAQDAVILLGGTSSAAVVLADFVVS